MSKNLCDTCRIHLLDCETVMCEIPRKVAAICGGGGVTACGSYKPMTESQPKPPEVVQVMTVEITQIGHTELGADSLRKKCLLAHARSVLRNAFPEADNINITQVQEFVRDGE